jgi:hypothetical protein
VRPIPLGGCKEPSRQPSVGTQLAGVATPKIVQLMREEGMDLDDIKAQFL